MRQFLSFSLLLLISSVGVSRSQLVLDDVADEFESEPTKVNSAASEPTDLYTKMLQWGVDNMDKSSVAEQAKAIREVILNLFMFLNF
jgi:hypothetical protein